MIIEKIVLDYLTSLKFKELVMPGSRYLVVPEDKILLVPDGQVLRAIPRDLKRSLTGCTSS